VAGEVLVRGEHTLPVQQVDVVHVVERGRGARVQVHGVRGLGRGTRCHQLVLEVRVDGWVRFDGSVDQRGAVSPPVGVGAGEGDNVGGVEVSLAEHFQ